MTLISNAVPAASQRFFSLLFRLLLSSRIPNTSADFDFSLTTTENPHFVQWWRSLRNEPSEPATHRSTRRLQTYPCMNVYMYVCCIIPRCGFMRETRSYIYGFLKTHRVPAALPVNSSAFHKNEKNKTDPRLFSLPNTKRCGYRRPQTHNRDDDMHTSLLFTSLYYALLCVG